MTDEILQIPEGTERPVFEKRQSQNLARFLILYI
jgi:hypothetical protein